MQILINDPVIGAVLEPMLANLPGDNSWKICDESDDAVLCPLVENAEVYVGYRFTPAMARAARALRLIQLSGAGYDKIPLNALAPGVRVTNTFHHERSMAEHIFMVMLALSRQLFKADTHLRQGIWESVYFGQAPHPYQALRGATVGLIGFGHIGIEVAKLAKAFEMNVLAVKRTPDPKLAGQYGLEFLAGKEALPELLRRSDYVVLALPLTDETRGIIGAAELAMMKPTAYLINVSRAPLVEEQALYSALRDKRIRGAALDVWYKYPLAKEHTSPAALPFGELDNVILTPHNSANTDDTYLRRAEDVIENIRRLLEGRPLMNQVHPPLSVPTR
jgi:phosphoglycerate dehydrogenase-like enzyme